MYILHTVAATLVWPKAFPTGTASHFSVGNSLINYKGQLPLITIEFEHESEPYDLTGDRSLVLVTSFDRGAHQSTSLQWMSISHLLTTSPVTSGGVGPLVAPGPHAGCCSRSTLRGSASRYLILGSHTLKGNCSLRLRRKAS